MATRAGRTSSAQGPPKPTSWPPSPSPATPCAGPPTSTTAWTPRRPGRFSASTSPSPRDRRTDRPRHRGMDLVLDATPTTAGPCCIVRKTLHRRLNRAWPEGDTVAESIVVRYLCACFGLCSSWGSYQGESWMLDSPEGVCPGQARFEYPATSVLFSICRIDRVGDGGR